MSASLRLQQYARVLRRGTDSMQVGTVSAGVVLSGLSPTDVALLEALERSREAQTLRRPRRPLAGTLTESAADLLDTLETHHLLADPCPPSRRQPREVDVEAAARAFVYSRADDGHDVIGARRHRWVLVDGSGRLPEAVGITLRDGAVGRVSVGTSIADDAELQLRAHRGPTPDVVVVVRSGAVPFTCAEGWRGRGVAHLPVVVDGPHISVGPLVDGRGPCLGCLDLHRADRDPAWPAMLRDLGEPRLESADIDAESSLRALTSGLVAALVYAHLDGQDGPPGHAVDVELPLPTLTHRRWSVHPRCRCQRERVTMGW